MSERQFKFTETRLAEFIAASADVVLLDTDVGGLQLRVQKGAGAYVVRYRVANAGQTGSKRLTLGRFGQMKLVEARQAAREALVEARAGRDPLEARRAAVIASKSLVSLDVFLVEYAAHQAKARIKSADERILSIRQHCPALLDSPLGGISRRQWVEQLDAVAKKFPSAAEKLRATIHHVYEIAIDRGVVEHNPLAHRRRQRGSVKNKNIQAAEAATTLSIQDLARLWVAAGDESVNPTFGCYIRAMIATGARRLELSLSTLENYHKASNGLPTRLVLKAETTKTGRDHTLYLPQLIAAEIERLPRLATDKLLFPGRRRGLHRPPMSGWSDLTKPLVEAAQALGVTEHIHLHGIRRAFRTGLSAIKVDRVVAEKMMAHASGDKLIEIYDKHQFELERAEAAQRWCDALTAAIDDVLIEIGRRPAGVADIAQARAAKGRK